MSTLGTHITLIALSSFLLIGVQQERCGLVTPWVVANIAFMALEAVCCMYANVLRDHVNKVVHRTRDTLKAAFTLKRNVAGGMARGMPL
ncbi:hypothetical protein Pcinc_026427 [Petrolisthes cinctipes]|uniref:Uncharacterized protein n=1 Tax=Petrolisthes cinctipes TaxID=88211 RepID=A0AAE1F6N6_PETCI|nr:hypothetical protein Pcinc_026427 [Petrolisthes cinctipes]